MHFHSLFKVPSGAALKKRYLMSRREKHGLWYIAFVIKYGTFNGEVLGEGLRDIDSNC